MTDLVSPKKCPRCGGTGHVGGPVAYAGVPGTCFKCAGTGVVEGDRKAIAAAKAHTEATSALYAAAWDHGHDATVGLRRLEAEAPDRLAKAVTSFAAGRTDVLECLAAHGRGDA